MNKLNYIQRKFQAYELTFKILNSNCAWLYSPKEYKKLRKRYNFWKFINNIFNPFPKLNSDKTDEELIKDGYTLITNTTTTIDNTTTTTKVWEKVTQK